ncbi:aldose 1-epimerase family protein [Chitinophagaceae bacterium MMS25-I14]
MKFTLHTDLLEIAVDTKGAELQKVFHKGNNTDYLWNGDSRYWGKHSPILFPIVGQLKDNTYYFEGKPYSLPRHGFARDMEFRVESHTETKLVLVLESNEETRKNYPFDFALKVSYTVGNPWSERAAVDVRYEVINTGKGTMYFSIGGHPAFPVPIDKSLQYEDYELWFNYGEELSRWMIQDGLLSEAVRFPAADKGILKLNKELFYRDALVFKHPRSNEFVLRSAKGAHYLHFRMHNCSYLGIWAARDAPFICIEPWCGVADSVHHNQQLTEKEGIITLEEGATWTCGWDINCGSI